MNEMRRIHRSDGAGARSAAAAPGHRVVNTTHSRRESAPPPSSGGGRGAGHAGAPQGGRSPKPKKEKPEKAKSRHPILKAIFRIFATLFCVGVMAGCALAVCMVYYVVQATANDGDLLNLDQIELLEEIPYYLQYAFICTEDKDFYSEPGFNLKRTVGAMINEYIVPIYSSKQGASTIEQQLIKNLTDDDSASGIEGALRKLREIYRAYTLYRNYSKETILEAYLNTISFTGTIQGVQTASLEYFGKEVSELNLWECAAIASITKNPTNYNPRTNPENLINRRNFVLYNMWDQGIITEDVYREAVAQPLVLAEEDTSRTTATNNSYFTDALFEEVVQDIMEKEGITEAEAQQMLYTGGFTIEATVNPKIQSQMEELMLNTGDAYFPAGWHEEPVSSLSEDDTPVYNEDGTLKTTTAEDGTVTYYRNVRTQAAMVMLDYDGNVVAMVGGLGEKTRDLTLNRAYNVTRQTGSAIKPIGAYALGIEYGLVPVGPVGRGAAGLPQRLAQLAQELRRQLRRQHRRAAVERSGPLSEHHRRPGGRPGGGQHHLQFPL